MYFFFISFTRHEVELSREAGQTWSLSDGTRIAHYIRDISEIPFRIGRAHCSHAGLLALNLLPFRCPEPLVIVPKPIGFMLMASIAISPKTASHSSTHQPRSFRPRTNLSQTLSNGRRGGFDIHIYFLESDEVQAKFGAWVWGLGIY